MNDYPDLIFFAAAFALGAAPVVWLFLLAWGLV